MKVLIKEFNIQNVDYRTLVPLQSDFKTLDDVEYKKLKLSFEAEGYFIPILVWKFGDVNYILDGHGRDKVLRGEEVIFDDKGKETYEIPCLIIEAESEKDAKEKLLIINSRYQQYNNESNFTDDINLDFIKDFVNIPDLDFDIDSEEDTKIDFDIDADIDEDKEKEGVSESIYELKEVVLFEKGLNAFDIPKLKLEMLTSIPEPIKVYCGDGKTIEDTAGFWLFLQGAYHNKINCTQGVLSFYSWDDRIEGVWKDTVGYVKKIQEKDYISVITPNFTVTMPEPVAWCAWQVYRSRWVGRYFQEAGITVIPDITWTDERSFDYSFLGLPKGLPCVSIQTQNLDISTKKSKLLYETGMQEMIKRLEPQCVFVYASPSTKDYISKLFPAGLHTIFVDSWITKRREKMR